MMRLVGPRTVFIAWVAFHAASGPPTGPVASGVQPASAAIGTVPLSFHGADPLRRFGFGSPFQHWTGWIVSPVGPPIGTVSSGTRPGCAATGTIPTPPHSAPAARRFGLGSRITPWTGRVISFPVMGGATVADGVHTGCTAAGKLVFANAASRTVVRYGKLFRAFGILKRWSGIVKDRDAALASGVKPGSSGSGTHTPIPYTGTAASAVLVGSSGTNQQVFFGPAACSATPGSAASGALRFAGTAASGVRPGATAMASLIFSGPVASGVLPASAARGTGPAALPGRMRYKRYRPGPLAGKGAR